MFFCPKCSYSLDLKKGSILGDKTVAVSDKKITVKSVTAGINQVIKNNINPKEVKPNFTKEQMIKNKNYGKLEMEDKEKMLEIFNQSGGALTAMFLCTNCNWQNNINSTVKLYSYDKKENVKKINPNEYFLIFNNPILSRTKDYTCKNKECETHKKPELKEAIFYHENNNLEMKYICGKCLSFWTV